jgi:hypothetical protein
MDLGKTIIKKNKLKRGEVVGNGSGSGVGGVLEEYKNFLA